MEKKILYHIGLYGFRKLIVYVIKDNGDNTSIVSLNKDGSFPKHVWNCKFPGIPLNFDIMTTYIIESPNGETHKLEVFRTATGFSVYVDGSNICESITEEDFLQELENPTF